MDEANGLSSEHRRRTAEIVSQHVREWIEDSKNDFRVSITRGVERRMNLLTALPERQPNGTITVLLEINGGAKDTSGPNVITPPPVVG